jgi:RimJ/RimL family protein N-acetyltransferase
MPDKFMLETQRLILRTLEDGDIAAFSAYRSDPDIARFQGWGAPFTEEQATEFIEQQKAVTPGEIGQWLQLGMVLKNGGILIGDVAFQVIKDSHHQAEIGMTLSSPFHKKGYGVEAVKGVVRYLFEELHVHRIIANCDPENLPAHHLLERVGFRREGCFIESLWYKGYWASEVWFALLDREWKELYPGE